MRIVCPSLFSMTASKTSGLKALRVSVCPRLYPMLCTCDGSAQPPTHDTRFHRFLGSIWCDFSLIPVWFRSTFLFWLNEIELMFAFYGFRSRVLCRRSACTLGCCPPTSASRRGRCLVELCVVVVRRDDISDHLRCRGFCQRGKCNGVVA